MVLLQVLFYRRLCLNTEDEPRGGGLMAAPRDGSNAQSRE